jgi:transposase
MPAIPPFIREPPWDQFAALLPQPQATHPLGCHRPRIPDQAIFDKLLQVLVFGCGYRRIADAACSATTCRWSGGGGDRDGRSTSRRWTTT